MIKIICEACGSNDLTRDGHFYVCRACGTKYLNENEKMNSATMTNMSYEECLENCDAYVKASEFDFAISMYAFLIDTYPERTKAYIGLIKLKGELDEPVTKEYTALQKLIEEGAEYEKQEFDQLLKYVINDRTRELRRQQKEAEQKSATFFNISMSAVVGTMAGVFMLILTKGRTEFLILGVILITCLVILAISFRKISNDEAKNARKYKREIAEIEAGFEEKREMH